VPHPQWVPARHGHATIDYGMLVVVVGQLASQKLPRADHARAERGVRLDSLRWKFHLGAHRAE